MLFDTHVNLHGEAYAEDLDEVFERAQEAGVERMIAISDKLENTELLADMCRQRANIWRSVGVHPHYSKDAPALDAHTLCRLARDEKVVAIGETGLDLHYGYSPLEDQVRAFTAHIEASQETGLPLIVHTREADELTGDLLEAAYRERPFPILMHCYTSGQRLADRARELDAYFSVSGILSFKRAEDVRAVALGFPPERVILETDCPYLAPVPKRGRRNEPAFLVHVAEAYADLTGKSVDEVSNLTTRNAMRLFSSIPSGGAE